MIDPYKPNFGGTPAARWRPRLDYSPEDPEAPPDVSIVTPFYRPGRLFRETVDSVMNQSLQQWEWIIVDDASPDDESREILAELRDADPRFRIVEHPVNRGRSAARNTGFAAARTDFVYQLDQDDLIEPTTLEKSLWCLVSHPEYAFVNGWSVAFGAQRHLWDKGFGREEEFLTRNLVTGRAMIRRRAFDAAGGYDESLVDGFEDWDLWLRCADRGIWGATIPEYLDWFRRRDPPAEWESEERIEAFREVLRSRYPGLFEGVFPATPSRSDWTRGRTTQELPFANRLAPRERRLLIVLSRLGWEAGGAFFLQAVELLVRQGWRVSVVAAFEGAGAFSFAKSAADVHVLSHFLAPEDHPRFLRYLIESRRPETVVIESGEFGRVMTAYLRRLCPQPAYLGFCHLDPNDPPDGSSIVDAVEMQRLVERLLVPSQELERELVAEGADPERLLRMPPAIDTSVWQPRAGPRGWLRQYWGAEAEEVVILFAGRLSSGIRPKVLAGTLLELERRGAAFRAVIIGEGGKRQWLEEFVARHELEARVRFMELESPDMILKALAAADLFFLPCRQGLAIGLLQAMAVGLVAVSADVGGQGEFVPPECGILIEPGDDGAEVGRYADELERLVGDAARRGELGRRARRHVLSKLGPDRMNQRLVEVLQRERSAPRTRVELPAAERAFESAVKCCRHMSAAELLRGGRDRLRRRVAERERMLRELDASNRELGEASAWLEQQRDNWEQAASDRDRRIAEQEQWIRELEQVREWQEGQRSSLLEEHEHRVGELEYRVRELEQEIRELEQEIHELEQARALHQEQATRWMEIGEERGRLLAEGEQRIQELVREKRILGQRLDALRREWNPVRLRRALAELSGGLRSEAVEPDPED